MSGKRLFLLWSQPIDIQNSFKEPKNKDLLNNDTSVCFVSGARL